jgi:hypothetical protein
LKGLESREERRMEGMKRDIRVGAGVWSIGVWREGVGIFK